MRKRIRESEFWITNITKRNVCLSDLSLTIPAYKSMNLLDKKHFHYNTEQLEKSMDSGSLFKKSNMVKVRKVAPDTKVESGVYEVDAPLFIRKMASRSTVKLEEVRYEELDGEEIQSEESFVSEMVDSLVESEESKK